jgi:hypothetical protein
MWLYFEYDRIIIRVEKGVPASGQECLFVYDKGSGETLMRKEG